MVTIVLSADGTPMTNIQLSGREGEYVSYLKAIANAVATTPDKESQKVLAAMLEEMLPKEHQLQLDQNS